MSEDRREALMWEAADIFLKLRDDPGNEALQARRDEFCARGEEERQVYEDLLKTWKASGVKKGPNKLRAIIVLTCGVLSAAYLAYDPLRVALLADVSTQFNADTTVLASGDRVVLDADSALIDDSDGSVRDVSLLEGAAFFDVGKDNRPFTVTLGDMMVSVVGTAFETAFVDGAVFVSVVEGRVNVTDGDEVWTLTAGDHFNWTDDQPATLSQKPVQDMAAWRADRLVVDNMTMGQAADIISRRLRGPVVFSGRALRNTRVTGTLDLHDPLAALRLLADSGNAQVYNVPGVGRLVTNK